MIKLFMGRSGGGGAFEFRMLEGENKADSTAFFLGVIWGTVLGEKGGNGPTLFGVAVVTGHRFFGKEGKRKPRIWAPR